jgi:hypothetical protein
MRRERDSNPEGLHLSGFQARSPVVRQRSRTFAIVRCVFHATTYRPASFANVRQRSPRLPSRLPSIATAQAALDAHVGIPMIPTARVL